MNADLIERHAAHDVAQIVKEALEAEHRGQADMAADAWDKIAQGSGDDPTPLMRVAEDMMARNELPAAEALFGYIARIYPTHLLAALKWVECALARRDWVEIHRRCALARNLFPDSSFGYLLAAVALREAGDLDAADAALENTTNRFPTEPGPMIHWVDCAIRRSDWVEAGRRATIGRERFPDVEFLYSMGASALKMAGQGPSEDALLSEAVARLPASLKLHLEWADCAGRREDLAEAARRRNLILERFPDAPDGFIWTFKTLQKTGEVEKAEAVLKEAADRFPSNPVVLTAWTESALQARDWGNAQHRAARLRAQFPDHPGSYLLSSRALRHGGRAAEAMVLLMDPLERFPSDMSLMWEASESLIELQRLGEAATVIDRALALHPRETNFLQRRVQLAMNAGDHATALAIWRQLTTDKSVPQSQCLDLAWTIFKVGPTGDDALELLRYLACEEDTGSRDWLPRLAEIVLLRPVRPELMAFARGSMPLIEEGKCDATTLKILRSALLLDYSPKEVRGFIRDYVAGGRWAITGHLFSLTYTQEKPEASALFRLVFEEYFEHWLLDARSDRFENLIEILGYLNFSAIFSHASFRRLVEGCAQHLDIETLAADASLQTPASVVGRIVSLANRAEPPRPISPAVARIRRLRIAVCVSGQMRGFEKAFPSWERMGFREHDTRYFIHTWKDIGRNWFRFWRFTQRRELLWETLQREDSIVLLASRYPTMTAACVGRSTCDEAQLRAFYGTDHVVVEDDAQQPFKDKSVPWKMHSKIERAHRLACDSGEEFDLYIRLRPDREVAEGSNPDLYSVMERSRRQRMIFPDRPMMYGVRRCSLGDQFAIGCREVMDIYSSTFSWTMDFIASGQIPLDMPASLDNHGSLAYRTFYGGLLSDTVPNLQFGNLFDPVSLTPAELVPLIEDDISGRATDEFDREFLAACRDPEA
jgi:tetratricopeptide (TPR) repeat protein